MASAHTNPTATADRTDRTAAEQVAEAAQTSKTAVKNAAETSKAAVMDAAKTSRDAMANAAGTVAERGSELAEQGMEQLSSFQNTLDDTVRRNPTAAVLGAIGIGVLIGMSMRGGRN